MSKPLNDPHAERVAQQYAAALGIDIDAARLKVDWATGAPMRRLAALVPPTRWQRLKGWLRRA